MCVGFPRLAHKTGDQQNTDREGPITADPAKEPCLKIILWGTSPGLVYSPLHFRPRPVVESMSLG